MTIERQLQLFNEMLDWASEMYDNLDAYRSLKMQLLTKFGGKTYGTLN